MKRITYAGGSIVTGNAVTKALLDFATHIASDATSVAVDIPVLESDGTTSTHTILLGPSTQFDVSDADHLSEEDEARKFPVPDLPTNATVAAAEPSAQAEEAADAFNRAVAHIDNDLDPEGV